VPMALNSSPPAGNVPIVSETPTMPCPPSAAHSADIRPMACCRAWYMVWASAANEPQPPWPDTWVTPASGPPNIPPPSPPGQP
jgi:hypothetical protein